MSTWAVVLAAGSADRFGAAKQLALLGGARLVDRAVATASRCCDAVVVVLPAAIAWDGPPVAAAVAGGATRAASVRAGLGAVPPDVSLIVIHDAAHPLASPRLFAAVIGAVRAGAEAAAPVIPLTETLMRLAGERPAEVVAHDGLVLVQMPHAFRASTLRAAHALGRDARDDLVLVRQLGAAVATVPGEPQNLHVTTREELALAERLAQR
jgi:2-C-methyl-D-erythritol 4-phosphate cytidylyltransferase